MNTSKISSIDDEVNEFQPLLERIFLKMAGINSVVKKQGTQEFGTDFVLSKIDNDTGLSSHVGVVVKTRPVNQQSTADVSRQINEAFVMTRTIDGQSVTVNEVWVVTSKNFSVNAQDFLAQQHKGRKVSFIDSARVASWVDKYCPDFWDDIPSEVSGYFSSLKESLIRVDSGRAFSIPAISVDGGLRQDIVKVDEDEYRQKTKSKIKNRKISSIGKMIEEGGLSIIEGEMGSGKSYLMRSACKDLCSSSSYSEQKIIPFYIDLKSFDDAYSGNIVNIFNSEFSSGFPEGAKAVFFIDSFDEAKMSQDERIDKIIEISHQKIEGVDTKVIVASRYLGNRAFLDKGVRGVSRYQVAPISLKQIIEMISKVCSSLDVKSRLAEDIKSSNLFKVIPRTPIAAFLLARLIQENRSELPSNLTELYSKYMELSLGRWDCDKGLQSEKEYVAAMKIAINLAAYFMDHNLPCISIDEAKGFFSDYLGRRNLGIDPGDLFDKVISRSDILIVDERYGTCGFKHRSFVEYFYALGRSSSASQVEQKDFDLYWVTSTYFWTGLLRDCPDHIDSLTRCSVVTDQGRLLKIINMGNMLLAAHQTPYEDISRSVKSVFVEAALLFSLIKSGEISSRLSQLSEMALLCVFRHLLSQGFGYEFFEGAIQDAILEIQEDDSISLHDKAYALFMLSTSAMSIDKKNHFFCLVDGIGLDNVPYSVQLGMQHEVMLNKLSGKNAKKVLRNLSRLAKQRNIKSEFQLLYDRPMSSLSVR